MVTRARNGPPNEARTDRDLGPRRRLSPCLSFPSRLCAAAAIRGDPALVKALARAHRWHRMLEAGEHGTARELAKAERVYETYICRPLRLTLLALDMVEAI